jgi:putative ABC transport system permease protein
MGARRLRPDPLIMGVRLSALHGLYRQRLRYHGTAELLAGMGIAVGVALVFGVLVANSGVLGSAREAVEDVNGSAEVKLVARTADGFDQRIAQRAALLPGVAHSAMLLRANAVLKGPKGERLGQLVGVTSGIVTLKRIMTDDLSVAALLLSGGIGLPDGLAAAIGVQAERPTTIITAGVAHRAVVGAMLDTQAQGEFASGRIAVAQLARVQSLAGEPRRVSEVLIGVRPGRGAQVVRELRALAGDRLDVVPAGRELALAEVAAKPTDQSTTLFAAISVMVGFLLALNAMLLTMPERRRSVAEMRTQGYDARQIVSILGYQAAMLGAVASGAGVLGGEMLARTMFDRVPIYLATAFPTTGHQRVSVATAVAAATCGMLASLLASLSPLVDLRPNRPVDAVLHEAGEPGQGIHGGTARKAAVLGVATVGLTTFIVLVDSRSTVFAGVALALALLCLLPLLFGAATRALKQFARSIHGGMVAVAVIELKATATRSVALAGIAALAVFGSIAIGGARSDLIRGLDQGIAQQWDSASVWVTPDENIHDVDSFHSAAVLGRISRIAAVQSVAVHQGAFLDVGTHRLWIRAVPGGSSSAILSSQLQRGRLGEAARLLQGRGWATVSDGFAAERHLGIGDRFSLPTPSGSARFRVAAVTTNIGWPPGTITIDTLDFGHLWRTADPTTLAVRLRPGVSPRAGRRLIAAALPSSSSLRVQTSAERIAEVERIARQGLGVLGDIAALLLAISALALAAALSTAVHQRRMRLSSLKAQGFDRHQLWRSILLESAVVIAIGCGAGAAFGLYGHALADRYLRSVTGFPAPFALGGARIGLTLLTVAAVSLAVIALPGYSAAGVSANSSFQE